MESGGLLLGKVCWEDAAGEELQHRTDSFSRAKASDCLQDIQRRWGWMRRRSGCLQGCGWKLVRAG
jgi:hypothetical protein